MIIDNLEDGKTYCLDIKFEEIEVKKQVNKIFIHYDTQTFDYRSKIPNQSKSIEYEKEKYCSKDKNVSLYIKYDDKKFMESFFKNKIKSEYELKIFSLKYQITLLENEIKNNKFINKIKKLFKWWKR